MVKLLVLQAWYGLSDPELERQATDRISFRRFLGCPESILTPPPSGCSGSASPRRAGTGSSGLSCNASSTRRVYRSRRAWPRTRPSLPVTRGMPGLTSPTETPANRTGNQPTHTLNHIIHRSSDKHNHKLFSRYHKLPVIKVARGRFELTPKSPKPISLSTRRPDNTMTDSNNLSRSIETHLLRRTSKTFSCTL